MRIAVMGTGGLGGLFGGLLARAGEDVAFIARGRHLEAIRANGLTVRSPRYGEFMVRGQATSDPAEVGPVDLVLFCVKSYDIESAAEQIRPMVGPQTVILPVQNGVDNAERIERVLGPGHTLGGLAWPSSRVEAPGVIVPMGGGTQRDLIFGELPEGTSPRTERLRETFERAGIGAVLSPHIQVDMWDKFVWICALALTTLTRLPAGVIRQCPETLALHRGIMEEVAAVGRARGVPLPADTVERHSERFLQTGPGLRQSQYYDLINGRRLEIETLNGALVRIGREVGVPTPLNFAVYAALKPYANGAPELPA